MDSKPFFIRFLFNIFIYFYRCFFLPIRVFQIRRKKIINVGFVISELGKWKTELLYQEMQNSSRFKPFIYVLNHPNGQDDVAILCDYLNKHKYSFHVFENSRYFSRVFKPDLLFYQEPYGCNIKNNPFSLYCYVPYAFHTTDANWFINTPMLNIAWQVYYENSMAIKSISKVMNNKGINCIVTGLPFTDLFLQPSTFFIDPWKKLKKKKRIIWAPHHTINTDQFVCHSTFMQYYDLMLSLAHKYRDVVQVVFKPHPVLKTKLYRVWGKERTDNYYSQWEKGENTQLVLGQYVPLFLYSDAMIHDCGSFIVEYHYTKKPVMYLVNQKFQADGLNDFGKKAFDLHYKGVCAEDIELFFNNIVECKDELKDAREKFYIEYLLPPDGNTASKNIMNSILG